MSPSLPLFPSLSSTLFNVSPLFEKGVTNYLDQMSNKNEASTEENWKNPTYANKGRSDGSELGGGQA